MDLNLCNSGEMVYRGRLKLCCIYEEIELVELITTVYIEVKNAKNVT